MKQWKDLPLCKGYYLLIIQVTRNLSIMVGRLGEFSFKKGYYIYVGSAHGASGIRGRVKRHLIKNKKRVWHIDNLTINENVAVKSIITICSETLKGESFLSTNLMKVFNSAVPRFGSSDTKDYSHLFYCGEKLDDCIISSMRTAKKSVKGKISKINL